MLERMTLDPMVDFPLGTYPVVDTAKAPLVLTQIDAAGGIRHRNWQFPLPESVVQWAESADSLGALKAAEHFPPRLITGQMLVRDPGEPAAQNLIQRPSIEDLSVGTSGVGWAASGSGASLSRVTSPRAYRGDSSLQIAVGNANNSGTVAPAGTGFVPVTPSTTYTFSVYLMQQSGGKQLKLTMQEYDGAGASLLVNDSAAITPLTTGWTRYTMTVTVGASTANLRVYVRSSGAQGTFTVWLDSAQLEAGSVATGYFDGDTPGCSWQGTRHGSVSIRPAPSDRFNQMLVDVEKKVARLKAEGGVLRREHLPSGRMLCYDVIDATLEADWDNPIAASQNVQVATVKLTAQPLGRGPKKALADHSEVDKSWLVFTETGIEGNMPSRTQCVVDNDSANSFGWAAWAAQCRYYDSAAEAALGLEAENLTPISPASLVSALDAQADTGATFSAVRHLELQTSWTPILETKIAASSTHLTHVGAYRVFARVKAFNNDTYFALEWSVGDYSRPTRNAGVTPAATSLFSIVDLGTISIPKATTGPQRWIGRILAKAKNTGNDCQIDWLFLMPIDEGHGEVRAPEPPADSPQPAIGQDDFGYTDNPAVGLDTKTADVGGAWTKSSSAVADGLVGNGQGGALTRAALDALTAPQLWHLRGVSAGDVMVDVSYKRSARTFVASGYYSGGGPVARAVSPWGFGDGVIGLLRMYDATQDVLHVVKGTGGLGASKVVPAIPNDTYYTIRLQIIGQVVRAWLFVKGTTPAATPDVEWNAGTNIATSGAIGIADAFASAYAGACTRSYEDFIAYVPLSDAVIFAGQSMQVWHDRVIREDSTGTLWVPVAAEGDYLSIPPTRREKRTVRVAILASRNDPLKDDDPGLGDDKSAQVFVEPTYLGWNPEV